MQDQTSRLPKPPCPSMHLHKLEHFKYTHTPYKRNSATKKAFATKSQFKEASSLITIIGMLTIRKDLSFPQKLMPVENLQALIS